jgi:hypothetical protein
MGRHLSWPKDRRRKGERADERSARGNSARKFADVWLRETATGRKRYQLLLDVAGNSRSKTSANAFAIGCPGSMKNPKTSESAAEAAPGLSRNNMFRALPNE